MPDISLCICTFNRERQLREALGRIAAVTIPEGTSYEVVVVDNNSTDGTPKVIQEAGTSLPISTVREARQGIGWARNAAATLARGDLLLWFDDDVLVESDWAIRYIRTAREHPEAGFFGGPVRAHFEGVPPGWIMEILHDLRAPFALRDFPPGFDALDENHLPFGANFATRRVVHQHVAFDPTLGRVGRAGGCLDEETEFFRGALRAGHPGRWVPDNPVLHVIPAERQTSQYLYEYYKLVGSRPPAVEESGPKWLGHARWRWRVWLENELKYRLLRHTTRPGRWFEYLKRAAVQRGSLFARVRE